MAWDVRENHIVGQLKAIELNFGLATAIGRVAHDVERCEAESAKRCDRRDGVRRLFHSATPLKLACRSSPDAENPRYAISAISSGHVEAAPLIFSPGIKGRGDEMASSRPRSARALAALNPVPTAPA